MNEKCLKHQQHNSMLSVVLVVVLSVGVRVLIGKELIDRGRLNRGRILGGSGCCYTKDFQGPWAGGYWRGLSVSGSESVASSDHQHQQHLGTCEKYTFLSLTLDTLHPTLWTGAEQSVLTRPPDDSDALQAVWLVTLPLHRGFGVFTFANEGSLCLGTVMLSSMGTRFLT